MGFLENDPKRPQLKCVVIRLITLYMVILIGNTPQSVPFVWTSVFRTPSKVVISFAFYFC